MKTLDCSTLEMLIENHEPLDLIDIRSKKEFSAMHIPGARWVPFAALAKPKRFLRWRQTVHPVYVVADDRVRASLAVGILRATGYLNATVVDGGMNAWIAGGFPVLGKERASHIPNVLRAGSILLGVLAAVAFAQAKEVVGILILLNAAVVFLKASSIARTKISLSPS
jgi:rhodanese-related sulfurtransferase